jgi:hypothetical protein
MVYRTLYLIAILVSVVACSKDDAAAPDFFKDGLAEGINYGLAVDYPNDKGLENNPYVLAVENFETGAVTIPTQYDRYKENVKVVTNHVHSGDFAGEHSWQQGHQGPTCRFPIPSSAHEGSKPLTYFVRMYFRYDKSFHPGDGMEPVGVKGFGIYNESGSTSEPSDGTNWYAVACQFVGWGPSSKKEANDKYLWFGHLYSYCPGAANVKATLGDIKVNNPGSGIPAYRFSIYSDPYYYIKFDEWYCYEVGLYLNTPGKSDGEARFWINGVLQSRATNMRFRSIAELTPQYVQLNLHRTTEKFPQTMKRYVDNIVIATRYIGPMTKE